ncbi:MAG TPA: hypothetical protein P5144_14720 [Thermoanaerobaculia bacterium]|nr:hypothetical protein [Thermoanaerobaculia bacterium]
MKTNELWCASCLRADVPLFRANEKGAPGIWKCGRCCDRPIDPAVKEIVDVVHRKES